MLSSNDNVKSNLLVALSKYFLASDYKEFKKYKLKYDKSVWIDMKRGGWRGICWKKQYFNKYEIENSDSDSD